MSFGAVALKDSLVPLDKIRAGLPAPTILSVDVEPNGDFFVSARMPRDESGRGAMLAWVKKDNPTHYPFQGMEMPAILATQNVLSLPMGGPPGATLPFSGNLGSLIQGGEGVEFACAASDDPDDLETP